MDQKPFYMRICSTKEIQEALLSKERTPSRIKKGSIRLLGEEQKRAAKLGANKSDRKQ
jgi:hypothetical protein